VDRLAAYGIGIGVPIGWEAELSLQPDPSTIDPDLAPSDRHLVVVHLANFWMPADRSDYGSEATAVMGSDGVFIAIIEFDDNAARSRLFEYRGVPIPLQPTDFKRTQLQRPVRNQVGLQRFFCSSKRAFCLHAVIGSYDLRQALTPAVNNILSGLTIEQQMGPSL